MYVNTKDYKDLTNKIKVYINNNFSVKEMVILLLSMDIELNFPSLMEVESSEEIPENQAFVMMKKEIELWLTKKLQLLI